MTAAMLAGIGIGALAGVLVGSPVKPDTATAGPTVSALEGRAPAPPNELPARPRKLPGIAPDLLQALRAAVPEDPNREGGIRIRVVSADQCGPTAAPGSDCLVGRVALAGHEPD